MINPLHPVSIDDYPKLFDYLVTKAGLIFLHDLKRRYALGKEMSLDDYNKLRLLQIYYATNNRNPDEVQRWKEICVELDERGIFEKEMFSSKESLIQHKLIIENPHYVEGLYRQHIEYTKNNSKKK